MSSVRNSCPLVCLLCVVLGSVAFGEIVEPNDISGSFSVSQGVAEATTPCSWFTALDRNGSDGGYLTVQFNGCYVYEYTAYTMEQGAATGELAKLQSNDIFVVWDEDAGHGSTIDFDFSGSYAEYDPNYNYVEVSGYHNWKVYQVETSGTLTVNSTGANEHDAFHLTSGQFPNFLNFWKVDDADECLSPESELTYEIHWDNQSDITYYDCNIIDYLPYGVDYDYFANFPEMDPNYNIDDHTYTWDIGDILPGDANYVTITVTVNEFAEPGGNLHNFAELWSDGGFLREATEDTPVCCWEPNGTDPNIIYVDPNAPGPTYIGTTWMTAYTDLQDALKRIEGGCVGSNPEIWVADGTYKPGTNPSDSFKIPAGVKVYGSFGGYGVNETSIDQRNFRKYESILNGYIGVILDELDNEVDAYNNSVVTMGNNSLLDGFSVEKSALQGIDASDVASTIKNCIVSENEQSGILCEDGNLNVQWSKVFANKYHGILHNGSGYTLKISNCKIHENQYDGIFTESSILEIKNSLVYSNGLGSTPLDSYYGINLRIPSSDSKIYNNTIIYNINEGVNYFETKAHDPNDVIEVDVRNNILWYNNEGDLQYAGQDPNHPAEYNCTSDADPSYPIDVNYNISAEPDFAYAGHEYPDANNFHIAYDSLCIDAGDSSSSVVDVNDVDMDNEPRIYVTDGTVDIGADEAYSCDNDLTEDDIYNEIDWNIDGVVNFYEYNFFSQAWDAYDPNHHLCDPNDPGYIDDVNDPDYISENDIARYDVRCDLNEDYVINMDDITLFTEQWLWEACWHKSIRETYDVLPIGAESMGMMSMESASMMTVESTAIAAPIATAEEQISTIEEILVFLDGLWTNDKEVKKTISSQQWNDFTGTLETMLYELENGL